MSSPSNYITTEHYVLDYLEKRLKHIEFKVIDSGTMLAITLIHREHTETRLMSKQLINTNRTSELEIFIQSFVYTIAGKIFLKSIYMDNGEVHELK